MNRYKIIAILLFVTTPLFSETKYVFRGYVESTAIGEISLDYISDSDPIERDLNQGFIILSNQYIKIVPEKGMSIIVSINETILSGVGSETYEDAIESGYSLLYGVDDSFILGLDIDRLFFSYRVDRLKTSFGIQRLSRGFNVVFTPFDFINTDNVTTSNLLQGKLSLVTEYETSDFSNLAFYFIPSEDPLEKGIWSSTTGLIFKQYGGVVDFQAQYNLLFPEVSDEDYNHLFGVAVKGNLIVGYALEFTYTMDVGDPELEKEGIDASVEIDYSFGLEQKLSIRCGYYFNGSGLDSDNDWDLDSTESYPFEHNLYGCLDFDITNYFGMSLSAMISPITASALGMLEVSYAVSDSSSLTFSANIPIDKTSWDLNNIEIEDIGEYGALRLGYELEISLCYRINY